MIGIDSWSFRLRAGGIRLFHVLNVLVLVEELERLLPVHVVELADVLDGVGLVVEAHGGADLAGVGLGARVDEEVLLQRVVVAEGLEADGALGAPVEPRPHVEAARAGLDQAAGRYELDLKMMGGRKWGNCNLATTPGHSRPWQHLVTEKNSDKNDQE